MLWNIGRVMGSSGHVLGLADQITCRTSSVEREENVIKEEEGKSDCEGYEQW